MIPQALDLSAREDYMQKEAAMAKTVSVVGSGDFGRALTKRLLSNGYAVYVGSRDPSRRNLSSSDKILANAKVVSISECFQASNVVIIAIPCDNLSTLLPYEPLTHGKVIGDITNPKKIQKGVSNAEKIAEMFPHAKVVKCFNTVSAYSMGDDLSNEHRVSLLAGDHSDAVEIVSQIARELGFATQCAGRLKKARDLEKQSLTLFEGWGWPTLFTAGLFIAEIIYLVIVMYILVDRYDTSQIPTYMMYKAFGAVSVNLLAFCYLPGVFAAFAQIYYGTKHKRFNRWLDMWLQGRKQLGVYAMLFAFLHMIAVMSCMNGAYFDYLFKNQYVTVKFNATEDTEIPVDTKMNLHGEGCIISGLIAITAMGVIGLTSIPAVGVLMNWREWRFIQSQFGFVVFLLTVGHCMVHGVPRWMIQYRELGLRNSFMSLVLPWFTLLLKIIYFIPCVNRYVWKIRKGHERGVKYDMEAGKMKESEATHEQYVNPSFADEDIMENGITSFTEVLTEVHDNNTAVYHDETDSSGVSSTSDEYPPNTDQTFVSHL